MIEREADRRRWSKRVSGRRPGRPARGDARRLPCRTLGEQGDQQFWMTGTTFGAGVANGGPTQLARGAAWTVTVDETITPGEAEYSALVSKMQAACVDVFFPGGLPARDRLGLPPGARSGLRPTAGFLQRGPIRELSEDRGSGARRHGHGDQHGHAGKGPGGRGRGEVPRAGLRAAWEFTLYAYAPVQVWAQAAEAAGSLDLDAVTAVMHSRQFDTVLGQIGFKGNVTGFDPWQVGRLAGGRQLCAAGVGGGQGLGSAPVIAPRAHRRGREGQLIRGVLVHAILGICTAPT